MLRASLLRFLLLALVFPLVAGAKDATPTADDPVAQARAVHLAQELRCLVCQNQTIAESNADLAVDLRRQIGEQIAAGRSDAEIVAFMVARYGAFVLYRPPLSLTTALLWIGPALLVLLGLGALALARKERRTRGEPPPLTADERLQAQSLLRVDTDK